MKHRRIALSRGRSIESRPYRSHRTGRKGATAVEFALVAPLFFLILLAAIEFAHVNILRNTANNAAYEAARLSMVPGASAKEGIKEAQRILDAVGTREATISVNPPVIDDLTTEVTVSIKISYAANSLFVPKFADKLTISSSSTLKAERYTGI